jgi:hypothetical protein
MGGVCGRPRREGPTRDLGGTLEIMNFVVAWFVSMFIVVFIFSVGLFMINDWRKKKAEEQRKPFKPLEPPEENSCGGMIMAFIFLIAMGIVVLIISSCTGPK